MLITLLLAVASPTAPAMPTGPDLKPSIAAADAEFFRLNFLGCDPAALRAMITPDLEFYHDKGGVMSGADAFVADYAKSCAARQQPDAWRSRRVLVDSSLSVDPVPGFGAIETGEHQFLERKGDGPETLAGHARFAIVWQWQDGRWKMRRVLSYAHSAAE